MSDIDAYHPGFVAEWAAVAAIADHLLAHETLEGEEVEDIVRQWIPWP